MITITRHLARRVRAVFRKALKITRGVGPPIIFQAGEDGLRIQTQNTDVAVEYHEAGSFPTESLGLPFEFLNDFTGGRDGPVELEHVGKKHIEVRWTEHGVPKAIRYKTPDRAPSFPQRPERMVEQQPHFISALKEASETTDPLAVRMALGCLELCGETGEIASTDAHQLLVQRGFAFPWEDKVLIPANPIWGSSELAEADSVSVGRTNEAVIITVGPWSYWFKVVKDARFPNVRDHIPEAAHAISTLQISDPDSEFLKEALKSLPAAKESRAPVTVELNGQVAIRAQAEDQSAPTELVLAGSRYQGQPLALNTDRQFLARALALGFREVHFDGAENPAHCQDSRRNYVWAMLEKDGVIKPSDQCVRIESPTATKKGTPETTPKKDHPRMTANRISQTKNPAENQLRPHTTAEAASMDSLIESAEALRTSLRESTTQLSELIAGLKQHRKQSKTLQSALSSIRALQGIEP